jgi:hypothetical protein
LLFNYLRLYLQAFLSERRSYKLTENTNKTTNLPDFDWEMDNAGFGDYNQNEREQMAAAYEKTLSAITEKEIVKGTVVGFTEKEVVLNIGFKSDGLVARTEFRDLPDLKIGDEVEVLLETKEDALGQLILSRKKAVSERALGQHYACARKRSNCKRLCKIAYQRRISS